MFQDIRIVSHGFFGSCLKSLSETKRLKYFKTPGTNCVLIYDRMAISFMTIFVFLEIVLQNISLSVSIQRMPDVYSNITLNVTEKNTSVIMFNQNE